jgi:hypothetical protein
VERPDQRDLRVVEPLGVERDPSSPARIHRRGAPRRPGARAPAAAPRPTGRRSRRPPRRPAAGRASRRPRRERTRPVPLRERGAVGAAPGTTAATPRRRATAAQRNASAPAP